MNAGRGGRGGGGRWPKKGSSNGKNGPWPSSGGGRGARNASGSNLSLFGQGPGAGNNSQGACFDFQRTGSCRFGSSCRFLHSTAGSNSVSGGSRRGPSKNNVCFDFQNGSCRYGSSCKFSHTSGGSSGMPSNSNKSSQNIVSQKKINTNDSQRFIKQLKSIQQAQVVDAIINAGGLWTKCWECAASSFSSSEIEILLHTLAKVPFSAEAQVEPPPIFALKDVVKKYLKNAETKGPNDSLLAAETTLNVARKLLVFEWEDKTIVKNTLAEILETAASGLQRRHSDHRDTIQRIDKCLDVLEKPWQIKERAIVSTEEIMAAGIIEDDNNLLPYHHFSRWKNATVAWLCYGPTFSPSANPKMQGPNTKSQGVYKSREHYFDTMQRLMIAMAFSEGHSALAPRCWERASGGGHCGSALVQIPDHEDGEHGRGGSPLTCRGKNCNNSPSHICKQPHHNRGLCNSCAVRETSQLLGPTGSTHVYNGHVSRVDANGKIYIQRFASRKPPLDETGTKQRQIHWRSTKRLAVPNLVGVVRLGDSSCISSHALRDLNAYRSLRLDDNIYWGEVSPHGNQSYEAQQRQQGNVCVNLASRSIFGPDECPDVENEFSEGDVIAIIDCQSFVPEYIPVIRSLEQQEQDILPFDDGALLNLDANRRADLSNTVLGPDAQNKAAAEGEFQRCIFDRFGYGPGAYSEDETKSQAYVVKTVTKLPSALIKELVSDMISSSVLLPLREIRQNPSLSSRMQSELVSLLEKATLDFGQLVSFIDALRNPVHVTQGPPGTGKSYLGVQLVHALTIIRNYWMQVNSSVGSPPILVLSYKNHATDEFLTDLLKVMGPSLSGRSRYSSRFGAGGNAQLVRMGNPGDPTLAPYSERALALRADPNVSIREKEVQDLLDLRRACQRAQRSLSLFQSYRSDMFDSVPTLDLDSIAKQQKASAYEATEVLYAALVRSHFLNTIVLQKETVSDKDNVLQSLLDIGSVLNQDKADDSKFKSLQKKGNALAKGTISDILYNLFEGIQHYITSDPFYNDPYELLFMFLMGESPKPICTYAECDATGNQVSCDQIADWHDVPLCHEHRCVHQNCKREVVKAGYTLCKEHVCDSDGCSQIKMDHQLFCHEHICFQCILLGISPALEALDEPPRNVCENHGLCSVLDCQHLAVSREDYCDQHISTRCQFNGCNEWAIARGLPYCQQHEREKLKSLSASAMIATRADDPKLDTRTSSRRQCMGKNKKKKPCKSTAMPGSDFCEAHAPKEGTGFKAHQKEKEKEMMSVNVQDESSENDEKKLDSHEKNPIDLGKIDLVTQSDMNMNALETASHDAIDEEEFGPPPDLDNVDLTRYDNADEIIEGEGEQHIREIFDIDSGDEIETDDEEEFQECIEKDIEKEDEVFHDCQNAVVKDPRDWMWSFSLDDRWSACQAFLYEQCSELQLVQDLVKHELPFARKRMHDAESRAKARVFENKTVIGGTIVGCIARLEQIRATRPFAIIVEEASEVMEPLLFACLSQSTVKFEMIGDHRQLAPSLMDKFDFTRINKVNVSMFERLICAPGDCCIPSGVLSVQRRMRKDICDLTREYYSDIVTIEDHPICSTKTIAGKEAHRTFWQGREVPGVESHLYLWAHNGTQGKADVGLSKQNREEAQMCVNLAYYLVHCGVSKSSIAILTPYKGQLMLIRKLLLSDQSKARLLTHDPMNPDQVRLSTVDRFQGDEADVVIASLVVDERSRTGFVKLQNRMIVLLSRARIGCFILGNIGYFEHAGGKDTQHWKRTFEMLESPPESSDNAEEKFIEVNTELVPASMQMLHSSDETCTTVALPLSKAHFNEARVGSTFPLCCPQHPLLSRFGAKVANDLQLGFCQIACDEVLPCSHTCGLKCHWPRKAHNKKCTVEVDSPCSKHPGKLQCTDISLNSTTRPDDSIDVALKCYKCPVKVSVMLPCCHEEQLSCWHEDEIAENKRGYPVCDKQARLRPNAEFFRYKTEEMHITSFDEEEIDVTASSLNDAGQLMISGPDFISMGVGEDGSSGLRLNYDLTRGSTSISIGFGGKELVGEDVQVFDVGLINYLNLSHTSRHSRFRLYH